MPRKISDLIVARKKVRLSQQRLAEESGIERWRIANAELGHVVLTQKELDSLAEAILKFARRQSEAAAKSVSV